MQKRTAGPASSSRSSTAAAASPTKDAAAAQSARSKKSLLPSTAVPSSRSAVKAAALLQQQQQQQQATAQAALLASQPPVVDRVADFAPHLLLQSRIERLTAEQQKLKHNTVITRTALQHSATESDELILYLDAQVRQRDKTNKELQSQLECEAQQHRSEMQTLRSQQAREFETATREFALKLDEVSRVHSAVNQSLLDIRLFCAQKSEIETDLAATTQRIAASRARHLSQLTALEHKYEAASRHLLAQSAAQLDATKQQYKRQIEIELDIDHAKDVAHQQDVLQTNQQFHRQLQAETAATIELQTKRITELTTERRRLRAQRDSDLQHGVATSAVLSELRRDAQTLDSQLHDVTTSSALELQHERSRAAAERQRRADDLARLQRLVTMKQRAASQLYARVQRVVRARNHVERCMAMCLHTVKQEILARRRAAFEQHLRLYEAQQDELQQAPLQQSSSALLIAKPQPVRRHIAVREFSPADRRRVLQLLFARLRAQADESQLSPQYSTDQQRSTSSDRRRHADSTGATGTAAASDFDFDEISELGSQLDEDEEKTSHVSSQALLEDAKDAEEIPPIDDQELTFLTLGAGLEDESDDSQDESTAPVPEFKSSETAQRHQP